MMIDLRNLLTLEQQELYDGVLTESQQNQEAAVIVLDRYGRLIEEQIRDMAAVRRALCGVDVDENLVHGRDESR